jgi:hypothetical protein
VGNVCLLEKGHPEGDGSVRGVSPGKAGWFYVFSWKKRLCWGIVNPTLGKLVARQPELEKALGGLGSVV